LRFCVFFALFYQLATYTYSPRSFPLIKSDVKMVEPCEALLADGFPLDELLVRLVLADDLLDPRLVVVRVQDLVQPASGGSRI